MRIVPDRTVVTEVSTNIPMSVRSTGRPDIREAAIFEPMLRTRTPKGVQRYTANAARKTAAVRTMGTGTPRMSPPVNTLIERYSYSVASWPCV
ncbi:MAG: hypothetical protein NT005_06675 [Spirochaetes bacterium]|nr:hypothetical protein [Spirochaetota bacterium]